MQSNIELVSGRTFLGDKGVELLYLGRGQYSRVTQGNIEWQTSPMEHLYIKVADLKSKIESEKLSPNFSTYNKKHNSKTDFWRTVFFSQIPRKVVRCTGELYTPGMFSNIIIEDYTHEIDCGIIYNWVINAE